MSKFQKIALDDCLEDHLKKIDTLIIEGIYGSDQRKALFDIGELVRKIRQDIAGSYEFGGHDPDAA